MRMATMSTTTKTPFAAHCSHVTRNLTVSTAVCVGNKGIEFPLESDFGKTHVGGRAGCFLLSALMVSVFGAPDTLTLPMALLL